LSEPRIKASGPISLPGGRRLDVSRVKYPIAVEDQQLLIDLWRTEWAATDFDWLPAMHGDYADTLDIHTLIAFIDEEPAGTASVYFPANEPEVALLGNVLTHPEYRGMTIARQLTERAVRLAFDSGCRVCYLGTTRSPRCVYLGCGFDWVSGGVMRRAARDHEEYERQAFAEDGGPVIRDAAWGDIAGLACLVAQPSDRVMHDWLRGIASISVAPMKRCVSNFPAVWYASANQGGVMRTLQDASPHRVLGFGSLTRGHSALQQPHAVVDVTVHDRAEAHGVTLVDDLVVQAGGQGITALSAYVPQGDTGKAKWFREAGFEVAATLPGQLQRDGRPEAVDVYHRTVS